MPGPITNGKDFNFFQQITISSSTFLSNADVVFNFKGEAGLNLFIQSGGPISYSFNGTTTHGKLILATSRDFLQFDNRRVSRIWFKLDSGSPATVMVEAWGSV